MVCFRRMRRASDCRIWRMRPRVRWLLVSLSALLLLLQGTTQAADVIVENEASGERMNASSADDAQAGAAEDPDSSLEWSTGNGEVDAIERGKELKEFPTLGKEAVGLLQLAEDSLGLKLSHLELSKVVPMLSDLQKHVHHHYLVTKATGKQVAPSPLLKRVVGRKSQNRVLKTTKKFAPEVEDGELIQQLDAAMQLVSELHANPNKNVTDIVRNVGSALGLDLKDEDFGHIQSHFAWAHDLASKLMPHLPKLLGDHLSDEL